MLLLYIAPSDGDDDNHDVVHNDQDKDDDHAVTGNSIKVKNKEENTPMQICHNLYIHQKCIFCQHILHCNPEEALLATNKNSFKNL